jgi:hypothetical protein
MRNSSFQTGLDYYSNDKKYVKNLKLRQNIMKEKEFIQVHNMKQKISFGSY